MYGRPSYQEWSNTRRDQITASQENMIAQFKQLHCSLEAMSRLQDVGMFTTLIEIILHFVRENDTLKTTNNFVIEKMVKLAKDAIYCYYDLLRNVNLNSAHSHPSKFPQAFERLQEYFQIVQDKASEFPCSDRTIPYEIAQCKMHLDAGNLNRINLHHPAARANLPAHLTLRQQINYQPVALPRVEGYNSTPGWNLGMLTTPSRAVKEVDPLSRESGTTMYHGGALPTRGPLPVPPLHNAQYATQPQQPAAPVYKALSQTQTASYDQPSYAPYAPAGDFSGHWNPSSSEVLPLASPRRDLGTIVPSQSFVQMALPPSLYASSMLPLHRPRPTGPRQR